MEPPAEIELKVGDDLVVRCDAVGKTPMFYQWFKEGEPLKDQTNNDLFLIKVNPVNEGLYICRVANVRGYQFSRWTRVVVGKEQPTESVELEQQQTRETVCKEEKPVGDVGIITLSGNALIVFMHCLICQPLVRPFLHCTSLFT